MFDKKLIVMPDVEFETKEDVIHFLTHLDNNKVSDMDGFEKEVLERESTFVTYVGYDIGMPHARTNHSTEPFVVYARLKNRVHWGENDGEDVSQVFLLGVPQLNDSDHSFANLHLKVLAMLSRNLMHDDFRESLNKAANTDDIYNLLINMKED
ncbi:MAG: PTS sugar transporter subunit IIA [Butyrivibrio sp.]|nr:PTS sugar transporter subunit IIA [Butyrivibrio sp.]